MYRTSAGNSPARRERGATPIHLATNNGHIGGGEVMLLRIARTLTHLDVDVTVVAPSHPEDMARAAEAAGLRTIRLPATDRQSWMRALRAWDRGGRDGILWCNGLVPAVATAGHANRIVHLHQAPLSLPHRVMTAVARFRATETIVPSHYMRRLVRGSRVLANWVEAMEGVSQGRPLGEAFTVGFIGRLSPDKGVLTLVDALTTLDRRHPGGFRLLLAGEPRFVSAEDYAVVEDALRRVAHLVERPGWMDRDEFFRRVDAVAVPSLCMESFGLVAVEAMCAQVPVVVSDAGALPEVVGHGGMVFPAGDSRALAQSLEDLTRGGPSSEGDRLYRRWERLYSPAAGAEHVRALLTRMGVGHRRTLPLRQELARLGAAGR